MLALRTPGPTSPDFPALEVLSDVLSSHRFDLYSLVPQGKAIDAEFGLDPLPQAGIAFAAVSFTAAEDPKAIDSHIRAILAKVAHDGVPADLVAAAKIHERSAAQFRRSSIANLASAWSDAIALHGLQSPDDDLARIEKVTVADVNRVARKYLDLDHAVSGTMLPHASGKPMTSGSRGFGGPEVITLGEAKPAVLPPWAETALRRLEAPPSTLHPVVDTLPNGITLIVQPENVSDTVSVYGHIHNRPEVQEPAGQEGVTQVLDELLSYGSEHLDRLAFEQAIDSIGASERAGVDFSVEALADHFDRAVELLADNELHPALPQQAATIIKEQVAQGIAARNSSPRFLTQHSLREALFGANDPTLRMPTPQTVSRLTLENVRSYYHTVFRPDLTTIVVIGNVTPQRARAAIEKYFGAWSATGPKPVIDLPAAAVNRPQTIVVPDASRVQDSVILAESLGITRSNPDYYALELGNAVLGGGFYSTRLSIHLRKSSGLVYSVGSSLEAGRTRTVYLIQYASDPQNVIKAANIIAQEIRTMQTIPVREDELSRAKALLVRQIPLGEADIDDIAAGLLARCELGLPLDEPTRAARRYIELRPEKVQIAFRAWMRPENLVRISEGPTPE
jgi:zinc protease